LFVRKCYVGVYYKFGDGMDFGRNGKEENDGG
jgi:hypothetical protein